MVFGGSRRINNNDNDDFRDEEQEVNDAYDQAKEQPLRGEGEEEPSLKESVFEDEDDHTTDDASGGSHPQEGTAASSNTMALSSFADSSNARRNMTVLFLFVVGMAVGFFVILGVNGRDNNNNDNRNDQSAAILDIPPTASPVSPPPSSDSDLFVEDPTSAPTISPTKVAPTTLAPTGTDTGVDNESPASNSTASPNLDLEGCISDMVEADDDGSGAIEKSEYLSFINTYGKRLCWNQEELTLDQHSVFNDLACLCEGQGGNSDADCCSVENAKLPTTNSSAAPTEEELIFMTEVCVVTDGTLENLCAPVATENPTGTPTLEPSGGATTTGPDATTSVPTSSPTAVPTTPSPTTQTPTQTPTSIPTTSEPTPSPTTQPTATVPDDDDDDIIVYGLQPNCNQPHDTSRFNICLDLSSPSGQVEDWFAMVKSAAQRWERVITSDAWGPWPPGFYTTINDKYIATQRPTGPIDDMYIGIIVGSLDGGGKRFAEAGPDRSREGQIISASILIDEADLQNVINNGIFEQLMLHELFHCLGLGTMWTEGVHYEGTEYIGPSGAKAWSDLGCSGPMPMANDQAHWNDDCFNTEVGTHFLRFGHPVHVSSVTMGALEDLGYQVDRGEEDAFGLEDLGNCGSACPEANRRRGRQMLRSSLNNTTAATTSLGTPQLNAEVEQSLLEAAAERFRNRVAPDTVEDGGVVDGSSVAYLYEHNGNYISRVIHRHQVEHLI